MIAATVVGVILAGCSASGSDAPEGASGESSTFKVGALATTSGDLADFGGPITTALELASDDINDAGGVNGAPVELLFANDGTDPQVARSVVKGLIDEDIKAVIGATSSALTLSVIDDVVQAGLVQCAPTATSPDLTDYPDNGLFFRASPSDVHQGKALADVAWADGYRTVATLAANDSYGQGLANAFKSAYEAKGGQVVEEVAYDPRETEFAPLAELALGVDPEALVIIGYPQPQSEALSALIGMGKGPGQFPIYGASGLVSEDMPERVEPGNPHVVDGVIATSLASTREAFRIRLQETDADVEESTFSAHSPISAGAAGAYDCLTLIALGAEAAESNDPDRIAGAIVEVTRGERKCSSYQECARLLRDGKTINYDGVSGLLDLNADGEPNDGQYDIVEWVNGEPTVRPADPPGGE